ncbi:hypothetical protein HC081234_18390 [Helicobacter cinaedi]|nr:hypothetical protein HC081234_18390 [Helicobacter cinaedi]
MVLPQINWGKLLYHFLHILTFCVCYILSHSWQTNTLSLTIDKADSK